MKFQKSSFSVNIDLVVVLQNASLQKTQLHPINFDNDFTRKFAMKFENKI